MKKSRVEKNVEQQEENSKFFPYQTKSPLLFSGYIVCGGCGCKLQSRGNNKSVKIVDGKKELVKYYYYFCDNANNGKKCTCTQKSYKSNTIETPVLNEIYKYLERLEKVDLSEVIKRVKSKTENIEGKQIKELEKSIKDNTNKLNLLKEEIVKSITGDSSFSSELLGELIEQYKSTIEDLEKRKEAVEKIHNQKQLEFSQMTQVKEMIPNWKQEFENSTTEQKKMLLSAIIKQVIVHNEQIEIKLKLDLNEFIKTGEKADISTKAKKEYSKLRYNRNSNIGFENNKIIEETLTAEYIEKVSARAIYIEKFKEYKREYRKLHHQARNNPDKILYKEMVQAFIEYMKPYNKALKNDEMSKKAYLKVLGAYFA